MFESTNKRQAAQGRKITYKTRGHTHGPITRLMSPGDLGQILKPFVFLDFFEVDTRVPGLGNMGYHPHSGIVTVTTIFEGGISYEDSTDKSGALGSGSVEWMQAGGGVWHTADSMPEAGPKIRGMQLWLALPAALENQPPESLYIDPHEIKSVGPARVIIGEYQGVASPLPKISPLTYLHVQLQDGEQWTFAQPSDHDVLWLGVDKGQLDVSGTRLSDEIAVFDDEAGELSVTARGETNFVIGSAVKHPYPLVTGSYSVHTNERDLRIGENGIREVGQRLRAAGKI